MIAGFPTPFLGNPNTPSKMGTLPEAKEFPSLTVSVTPSTSDSLAQSTG
jgi:hypothetical protein